MIHELERERLVVITPQTPGFDPEIESQFTHLDYAAILIEWTPSYILAFGVRRTEDEDNLRLILETIRTAIALKLRQNVLETQLRQAQTIQLSLLPRRLPQLEGFDVAASTFPAEEVGGDIYDAQEVEPGVIGVAVADASGHGLPAALQARDVITGLRMGSARDLKIQATIRRLNQVINKSGLSSRFVSLFFAEVEETGNIIYVNAGHCPPLLITPTGSVFELPSNGPVLGPLPDMAYRRSYATLRPGEALVIFSDGVTERHAGAPAIEPPGAPASEPPGAPAAMRPDTRARALATASKTSRKGAAAQPHAPATAADTPRGEPQRRNNVAALGVAGREPESPLEPPPPAPDDEREEFGLDRLVKVCQENLHRRAHEMVTAVFDAVRDFGGGAPWEDDVTVMVIKRLPEVEFKPKRTLATVLTIDAGRPRPAGGFSPAGQPSPPSPGPKGR
jgi:serine phosphatase RsbU (regulator of sigma subunit)